MIEVTYTNKYCQFSRAELVARLQANLSSHRFEHCVRVEQTALQLAQNLPNVDLEQVSIAALLHDYAKEVSDDRFLEVIKTNHLDPDLTNWGNFIWHGVVGAEIIADELKITDDGILTAIRQHTVGAPKMSVLAQLVYVADYVEPARNFPDVTYVRTLAQADLGAAVSYETKHTLSYLLTNNKAIHPQAIATYNAWVVGR